MQAIPGVSSLSNKILSLVFGVAFMSHSFGLLAVEDDELWRGFPNKSMYSAIECPVGIKQVREETLAALYGALWVDQPEPSSAQDLEWGVVVKNKPVKRPWSGQGKRKEDFVTVSVLIDEKSNVVDAHVICSTDSMLNSAVLAAAMKSKYKPVYVAGKPTLTVLLRPYKFSPNQ